MIRLFLKAVLGVLGGLLIMGAGLVMPFVVIPVLLVGLLVILSRRLG